MSGSKSPSQLGREAGQEYVVTVRLDDMVHTGESSANWPWDFNPTRFVINDSVQACVSKDRLRLRRQDGKDYETEDRPCRS